MSSSTGPHASDAPSPIPCSAFRSTAPSGWCSPVMTDSTPCATRPSGKPTLPAPSVTPAPTARSAGLTRRQECPSPTRTAAWDPTSCGPARVRTSCPPELPPCSPERSTSWEGSAGATGPDSGYGAAMYAAEAARTHPDEPAIVMATGGVVVTFGEYEATANCFAHLLRDAGLRRRDHAAVFMDNDPRMLMFEGGAERTGLYYTCINSYLSAEEVAYVINDSEA